jgi:hypothetical protein
MPKPNHSQQKSAFAEHLIKNNHNAHSFSENLEIIHKCKKSQFLNTLEELEIYKSHRYHPNDTLNEKLNYGSHILFNSIMELSSDRSLNTGQQRMGEG